MSATLRNDDVLWMVEPGQIYFDSHAADGILRLYVDGYRGRVLVSRDGFGWLIRTEDGDGQVGYTLLAGAFDVIVSVAETMLAGLARKAGIEVIQ
jgi:hypothetical protein